MYNKKSRDTVLSDGYPGRPMKQKGSERLSGGSLSVSTAVVAARALTALFGLWILAAPAAASPLPPSNLSAFSDNGSIRLAWSASPDLSDDDKYQIEISSWSPSSFTYLAEILHPGATHLAVNLVNGNTYFFRVNASTGAAPEEISEWSGTASAAPWVLMTPPVWTDFAAAMSADSINWAWTASANALNHFVISLPSGADISGDLPPSATYWPETALIANTSSQVLVRAVNGLLVADSPSKTIYTLAATPTDFRSSLQPGTTRALLEWSAAGNPASVKYRIQRSTYGSGNWFQIVEVAGGAATHLDTGLAEKTTYSYRIRAVNSDEIVTNYVEISTRTGSVNPQSPALSNAEQWNLDGEIRLTFTAPYDDAADEPALAYVIKYATHTLDGGGWDAPTSSTVSQGITPAAPGAPQTHIVTGLYPGTTFYFAMKSVDEVGNLSAMSAARNASARDNPPNPPENITAVALSETNIRVTWSAPSVSGYDDRDKYWFYRGTFPFTLASQATFYVDLATYIYQNDDASGGGDNPIKRETTYYYRMATSDLGSGPAGSGLFSTAIFSQLSALTSLRTPDLTPPPAITTLTALTGNSEGRINLSWTSPTDNSIRIGEGAGENIVGGAFLLRWTTNFSETFSTSTYNVALPTTTSPGALNSYLISGLTGGATYHIKVWTRDESFNWSPVSLGATAYAQVDIAPPGAITAISASADWRRINLVWTAPGDDGYSGALNDSFFEIRLSSTAAITNDSAWNAVSAGYPYRLSVSTFGVSAGSSRFLAITGLANSVTYYAAIKTVDDTGNYSPISTMSPSALPLNNPPSAFSLVSPANVAEIQTYTPQLTWSPSSDADIVYSDAFAYDIYYSTSSGFELAVTTVVANHPDAAYTVPSGKFFEDKRYYWKVAARDLDGAQRFSNQVFSLVINVENSTPTAPTLQSPANAFRVATATPTLSWTASQDSDILDVLYYTVHYTTSSPAFSQYSSSAEIVAAFYVTPSLIENATYWWRVFVTDGKVEVQGDATRYFKVNATAEPPRTFNLIVPSENWRSTATVVNFSWGSTTDPDPDEGVSYNLIWSQSPVFSSSITVSGLVSTTAQVSAPSDNSYYYWKIEAIGTDAMKRTSNQSFGRFYVDIEKELPLPFSLLEPEYGVIISSTLKPLFRWNDAVDPDPADTVRYYIEVSQNPEFTGAQPIPTAGDTYFQPLSNLIDQATYFWRVRASGYQGSPAVHVDAAVGGGYTFSSTGAFIISMVNYPPEPFALVAPSDNSTANTKFPAFHWAAAADSDVGATVTYAVEVSSSADFMFLAFSTSGLTLTTITSPVGLFENRTYWWRVTATDNKGAATLSSAFAFQIPVLTIPQSVLGIKTSLSASSTSFMILWTPVLNNADGSAIADLAGYNIYKSIDFDGLSSVAPYVFVDKSQTSFTDAVSGNFFYKIRSVDISGVESADSLVFRTFAGDAAYAESPDRVFVMEIPSEVARSLGAAHNKYAADLMVKISTGASETALSGVNVIREFDIELFRSDGSKIDRYTFAAAVKLRFSTERIKRAAAVSGAPRAVEFLPSDIAVFWHNGVEFLKFPSAVDSTSGEAVTIIANAGKYQIRRALRPSSAGISAVNPPKVFTPG
ncbi:MAG: fibronectin type III domain-containing protein, partial [Endomicrobiia bacterium]|nr:fibronectin type III domain-containing protein [Endomicrobiia bacterium]